MIVHLRADEIIDREMEGHYSFKSIRPWEKAHGRISTTTYHDHDFFELFLISHGRIWHLINRAEILLPTGALVFIRPDDRHSFRQYQQEDCGLINLAFLEQVIFALFAYLGEGFDSGLMLRPELPPMVLLSDAELQATAGQLATLNSIPHTEKERIRTQMRLLLVELLARYLPENNSSSFEAGNAWLHDLCNQMQEPENMRQGVSRLQALAHTSPEHLSRTFRKELGCTPTQYVNKLRLTYAANLLYRTDRPISEIANEVGLANLSYFYRIFKKQFDMTPTQFRAQKQKKLVP